jgi:hypothetical protein
VFGDTRAGAIAGLIGGVVLSAAAGVDYVAGGALGENGGVTFALVHAVGYAGLLVAAVGVGHRYRPALGRLGRATLNGLVGVLGVLGAVFAVIAVVGQPAAVQGVAGIAFLAMFVLGSSVGLVLLRRTSASRVAAALLLLTLPMMIGASVVGSLGWFPVHPALGEVPLYLGIATLGYQRLSSTEGGDERVAPALNPH